MSYNVRAEAYLTNKSEGSEICVVQTYTFVGKRLTPLVRKCVKEMIYNLLMEHPQMNKKFCGSFHGSPSNITYYIYTVTNAQLNEEKKEHLQ